jgi:ABC-2 type transport system ATP-binding protein
MSLLALHSITKTFGSQVAVQDLSFSVEPGEIFGLLGPNGAGKTTTIRMALDLFRPDTGTVEIFGGPIDDHKKNRIGYMPEERGLYDDMELQDCLTYLGQLKGLSRSEAHTRVEAALKRLDLWDHRKKKIEKLSRGMAQKAQIIAATVHTPDLLIVDEPFANLDPVNIDLVKQILLEMKAQGKGIIMSSHQLPLVEALCDRIVLINKGERVVYGTVRAVKEQFAGNDVLVAGHGQFEGLPGVEAVNRVSGPGDSTSGLFRLSLAQGTTPGDLFRVLAARPDFQIERFEVALPSLEEVFLKAVKVQTP